MHSEEWVSVSEKLPDVGEQVLMLTADKKYHLGSLLCEADDMFNEPVWYAYGWYKHCRGAVVDYWMPLPEPPEDADDIFSAA